MPNMRHVRCGIVALRALCRLDLGDKNDLLMMRMAHNFCHYGPVARSINLFHAHGRNRHDAATLP
jgi:hypothetical protein